MSDCDCDCGRKEEEKEKEGAVEAGKEGNNESIVQETDCCKEGEEDKNLQKQQQVVVSDPISESYRSIVEVINRTSKGFKEGKKWKCVAGNVHNRSGSHKSQKRPAHTRERLNQHRGSRGCSGGGGSAAMLSHSNTIDERQMGKTDAKADSRQERSKRFVRQKACATEESSNEPPNSSASTGNVNTTETMRLLSAPHVTSTTAHLRLSTNRGFPVRQWTIDTSGMSAGGGGGGAGGGSHQPQQAYLLRPISRNSIMSASGGEDGGALGKRLSPSDPNTVFITTTRPRGSVARSPMTERIRLGELSSRNTSFNVSSDGATSMQSTRSSAGSRGKSAAATRQRILRKQRTCESVPMHPAGPSTAFGGSSRYLPRQHSNASAYSAVIPTSYSHQGMTLVRGASCSLVDIPTYLGHSVAATGGVELAQLCDVKTTIAAAAAAAAGEDAAIALADLQRKNVRPRLQLDLTRKKNAPSKSSRVVRQTQWTVLCVGVTLLMLAVTLVGTMLSVGSRYQEMVFAKKWEDTLSMNKTAVGGGRYTLEEPYVIVPNTLDDDVTLAADDGRNVTDTEEERGPAAVGTTGPEAAALSMHLPFYVELQEEP